MSEPGLTLTNVGLVPTKMDNFGVIRVVSAKSGAEPICNSDVCETVQLRSAATNACDTHRVHVPNCCAETHCVR